MIVGMYPSGLISCSIGEKLHPMGHMDAMGHCSGMIKLVIVSHHPLDTMGIYN